MKAFDLKRLQSLVLLVFATSLAACSSSKNASSTLVRLGGDDAGIVSNRPINKKEFVAVIKLKAPALLSSAKKQDGKTIVDADLAKQVDDEQTKAVADLKEMSSEIRILFRYRMVLNGLAIVAPMSLAEKIKANLHVAYVEKEGSFGRPVTMDVGPLAAAVANNFEKNSVKFIGAEKTHGLKVRQADGSEVAVDGTGMKVGIIDTGIDYTHAMFGGVGTVDAYKAIEPSKADSSFPTGKIAGGIDLAGTTYDSNSGDFKDHVPVPDDNPLDEGGHGTHVAGTVAGLGDGVETYSGVAPGALLYAIKVFGAEGSTGDAVVIAGLEFSADPNRDGDLSDQMDVINMSLGSSYGNPHVLYSEAIRNLVNGGTVVVASAGNSGNLDNIVGAPSIVDEAISVAASIDDGPHNWQFNAVEFVTPTLGSKLTEAVEGSISKPVAEAGPVSGSLVEVGLADQDFSPELVAQLKGQVALIDRGKVTFAEKAKRAFDAGAVGFVVVNNQDGGAFAMGGDGQVAIPGIMISLELGQTLKDEMTKGAVLMNFQTTQKIQKPELIDTLTDFSSKGPRSIDSLLKPEISAPGSSVISAKMGGGDKGVKMSGTSMSGPHIAGVMALLKQAHPELSTAELKSILMGHATSIKDEKGVPYLLSRQGAGRVQTYESATAQLVADRGAISLGEVNLETQRVSLEKVTIKNISTAVVQGRLALESSGALQLQNAQDLTLQPGESKQVSLKLAIDGSQLKDKISEVDGMLKITNDGRELHRIPVVAIVRKISQLKASKLKVHADSPASSAGALVEMTITNAGKNTGAALPFNLLGVDQRKLDVHNDSAMSKACDLQAVGYRVIEKTVEDRHVKVLQVGVKLYEPLTTWNACEISILIDSDGDKVPEQELAGIPLGNVKGLSAATNENQFTSVLLDAAKTRDLRRDYEKMAASKVGEKKAEENYAAAVIDELPMQPFNHSTVVVVEADVTNLAVASDGLLHFKVATIFNEASTVEMDDYLGRGPGQWQKISLEDRAQAFMDLPELVSIEPGQSITSEFTKGEGFQSLLLLYPDNRSVFSSQQTDLQSQILK